MGAECSEWKQQKSECQDNNKNQYININICLFARSSPFSSITSTFFFLSQITGNNGVALTNRQLPTHVSLCGAFGETKKTPNVVYYELLPGIVTIITAVYCQNVRTRLSKNNINFFSVIETNHQYFIHYRNVSGGKGIPIVDNQRHISHCPDKILHWPFKTGK